MNKQKLFYFCQSEKAIIMKISRNLYLAAIALFVTSCATSKLIEEGNVAYQAESYETALNKYDQVIESKESVGKKAKAPVYVNAGIAALELEQTDKARKYLESAKGLQYSSPKLYESLAHVYKIIDNLSKEITALETYHKKYPNGESIETINERLLETYVESENWNYAVDLWPSIENQAQTNVNMLANYLIVNKNLENTAKCEELAKKIYEIEPDNIVFLEYYAEKYFWEAENLYTTEMNAYKKHRTNSQYKKLLKALDQVWPNYQKSRDLYLKLYKIDPKPEYAEYLGNIYTRYKDEKKAAYYYKRAKQ